jgi:hypothetical protein
MSATKKRSGLALRRLPVNARTAAAEKAAERSTKVARSQFSRVFADVLSNRFGGRWSVDWDPVDHSALSPRRSGQSHSGKK